jgi:phosphoglycerate dehydrogenase-like enzyme
MIDLHAMKKYDVKLGWKGGVNKRSVSELVVSFSIILLHRVVFANSEVRNGKWYQVKGRQLSDCTFGIIGCGHVGKDVIRLLHPFGCNILAHDVIDFDDFYKEHNVLSVELNYLLKKSDVITLHLPLDNTTSNILNRDRLKLIKRSAVLINLARGGLLDETELRRMIINEDIAGVALDVFAVESPIDNTFSMMDNVLITPHIGGSTEEAIIAMGMATIEGLENAKDPLNYI